MMILLLNGVTPVSIWEDISKVTSMGLYCENETSEADERNQRWCGVGRGDREVRGAGVGVEGVAARCALLRGAPRDWVFGQFIAHCKS